MPQIVVLSIIKKWHNLTTKMLKYQNCYYLTCVFTYQIVYLFSVIKSYFELKQAHHNTIQIKETKTIFVFNF